MNGLNRESLALRLSGRLALLLLLTAAMAPFLAMLSISLQDLRQIRESSSLLWPRPFRWENYAAALSKGYWLRYFSNSLIVSVIATAVSLPVNALTGYAFARIEFPLRRTLFLVLLIGMMIPQQVTLVPLFALMRGFPLAGGNDWLGSGGSGLVNTRAGLILPYAAGSFGVFMCRQFYAQIPAELDEAAKLDGCSRFAAFRHVFLPLSKPALGALAALKFTGCWNDYAWPLVMTDTGADRVTTVQLALTRFRNEGEVFWNELMAATLLATLVVLLIYLVLQRYLVSGLLAGSVKG